MDQNSEFTKLELELSFIVKKLPNKRKLKLQKLILLNVLKILLLFTEILEEWIKEEKWVTEEDDDLIIFFIIYNI